MGFVFGGQHSSLYHVTQLKGTESILPATREKVRGLPGRHGVLRLPPDLGERTVRLACWLDVPQALAREQRQERQRQVAAWLNPLKGIQQLRLDSDSSRFINAQVTGGIESSVAAKQGTFTVEFACPDPFWYSVVPQSVVMLTSPLVHVQTGTIAADPLFRLQGVASGAGAQQIMLSVDAQVVVYKGALASGDWLEIDSSSKTVTRVVGSVRTSVMRYLERPVFPQLAPGPNVITVTASGGASWSRLEISCRNRWL